jgi:hypothetical protein
MASTYTGTRILAILQSIDWSDPAYLQGGINPDGTRISDMTGTGDAINVAKADGKTTALAMVQALLQAEQGIFFISADGIATYEPRSSRVYRQSAGSLSTAYLSAQPGFELDTLVNRQTVQAQTTAGANNGVPQTSQDPISIGLFGISDGGTLSTPYVDSTQAQSLGQYIVSIKSSFVTPITAELDGENSATVVQQLSLDLGDRVTVVDATQGISGEYHVEQIHEQVDGGGMYYVTQYLLSAHGTQVVQFAADGDSTPVVIAPPDGGDLFNVTNKALTSNVATLTVGSHSMQVGATINVTNVGAPFDGTWTVTATAATTVSFADVSSNVASVATTGSLQHPNYSQCISGNYPTDVTFGRANAWIYETDTGRYFQNTGTLASPTWTQTVFPVFTY